MSDQLEHIWPHLQAELALAVEESAYRIWLAPLRPRSLFDGCLQLEAPNGGRSWISDRFGRVLEACAAAVIAPGTTVELVEQHSARDQSDATTDPPALRRGRDRRAGNRMRSQARPASPPDKTTTSDPLGMHISAEIERTPTSRSGPLGNPKLTFEQFVIGDSN
ncbi:MAG TPA: DnaA N-terminal domain-containing protein, partial [Solirubrobacteraceae bacterium]